MNDRARENEQLLQNGNVRALLTTIARSEGAGYGTLVFGKPFNNEIETLGYGFAVHPAKKGFKRTQKIKGKDVPSTAAGAYQINLPTYNEIAPALGISDFSPRSQDIIAVELLRRAGAIDLIIKNDFDGAIFAARKRWASLPGAGYNQHERSLDELRRFFNAALQGSATIAATGARTIAENPGASLGIVGLALFGLIVALAIRS